MEQQELQRIAQLVEMNRQKMARIEEQVTKLTEIRLEQLGVISALKTLDTNQSTMIPLGAGVQLPASPKGDTVVIDIGSGVQAERPREEAISILEARLAEVEEVLNVLQTEFTETETIVTELANTFTDAHRLDKRQSRILPATRNRVRVARPHETGAECWRAATRW